MEENPELKVSETEKPISIQKYRDGEKSLKITYICWFIGGLFGLHHFYLGRDKQAFVWACSLGYYGIGFLTDFTKIPEMVAEANEEPQFIENLIHRMQTENTPKFDSFRFFLQLMFGSLFARVAVDAIPVDSDEMDVNYWRYLEILVPLFNALGVWLVGNMGREKGSIKPCVLSSYFIYLLKVFGLVDYYYFGLLSFVATLLFQLYSKQWRREPPKKRGVVRRGLTFSVFFCLYLMAWGSFFYHNVKVQDKDGNQVPIKKIIANIYSSSEFETIKESYKEFRDFKNQYGWYEVWKQVRHYLNSGSKDSEENAYRILGLSSTSSLKEITATWRKLSREFHPDKVKNEDEKQKIQEKFIEVQQAYQTLLKSRGGRHAKYSDYDEF